MDLDNQVIIKPSTFAESIYLLDGQPFRLKNRNYLKAIYDSDIEEGMIMSGRQVEKSTTNSTAMANYSLLHQNFKGLYFAPLTSQVKEFSTERLGKLYEYSQNDVIKNEYLDKHDTKAVFMKTIKKTNATLYLKHCFGTGDNIRGITVNGIWGDEIQDVHIDAIPVIAECQAHAREAGARMKVTWYTGTPKTYSNTIQQYWDRSTQNEWVVKCPHCGKYQILGVKNLSPNEFLCMKCRMNLPKENIINGLWYELQPGKKLKGFRISQIMVPWITAEDIWKKYEEYPPAKFQNEVLGRSYENADKPFTPGMLGAISANNERMIPAAMGYFTNRRIYLGVDWGTGEKSYTIVTISSRNANGKFQLLYTRRYAIGEELDPEYQMNDICRLMSTYKVVFAVVDWGFGYDRYKKLQKIFGVKRVVACYYSFNLKEKMRYDAHNARWIVNRSEVMQEYVNEVKDQRILWPGASKNEFPWLYEHHLCEQCEYRVTQSGRSEDLMFTHPEGQPDDGLHSSVYCLLAEKIDLQTGGMAINFSSFQTQMQ